MRHLLLGCLLFNAVTAITGGLMLVFGVNTPPQEWLASSPFASYVIPGLLLGFAVGGLALLAFIENVRRKQYAGMLAIESGIILLTWIIGEFIFIQQFSWLQLLYIISGITVIATAYNSTNYDAATPRHVLK